MNKKYFRRTIYLFWTVFCVISAFSAAAAADAAKQPLIYGDIEHYFSDNEYNFEYENDSVYLTHYIDEIFVIYFEDGSAEITATVFKAQYNKKYKGFQEEYDIIQLLTYPAYTFPLRSNVISNVYKENSITLTINYSQDENFIEENSQISTEYEESPYTFQIIRGGIMYFYDKEKVYIGEDSGGTALYLEVLQIEYKTKEGKNITAYDNQDALNLQNLKDTMSNEEDDNVNDTDNTVNEKTTNNFTAALSILSIIIAAGVVFIIRRIMKIKKGSDS